MSRTYRKITNLDDEELGKRDNKKWYKPNSIFKKIRNRSRRSKVKDSIRKENEIPLFKNDDVWDWN